MIERLVAQACMTPSVFLHEQQQQCSSTHFERACLAGLSGSGSARLVSAKLR
ncbi:MAG TPA: hypothetical protein VJO32_09980 [Ktedonobacteraceae bacterium]|nr:hypothetical protein [Ktedonobacteraceae bacterium]